MSVLGKVQQKQRRMCSTRGTAHSRTSARNGGGVPTFVLIVRFFRVGYVGFTHILVLLVHGRFR